MNEFSAFARDEEIERELKERERRLDEELKKTREDTLLGTCRILRRQHRPTVYGKFGWFH